MRGKQAKKRILDPDIVYNSVLVSRFINKLMMEGKKSIAQDIFYGALDLIKDEKKLDPLKTFEAALANAMPQMEVRTRRVGGANYQVPIPVEGNRQESLGIKWIIEAARAKKGQGMAIKLATELVDAANNTGSAIKKKEDVHKMAESNKAFAHFR
jgi:small subunit ribosomal protein S7